MEEYTKINDNEALVTTTVVSEKVVSLDELDREEAAIDESIAATTATLAQHQEQKAAIQARRAELERVGITRPARVLEPSREIVI